MSNKLKLNKLLKKQFPNDKNRLWTMCQSALGMVTACVDTAEHLKMTDEGFYLHFEDALNLLSVKDHNGNEQETEDFKELITEFNKNNPTE